MAIKRFCDRCGKQISDDELSMVVPEYIPTISSYLRVDRDICAKCMTQFVMDYWKKVQIDLDIQEDTDKC